MVDQNCGVDVTEHSLNFFYLIHGYGSLLNQSKRSIYRTVRCVANGVAFETEPLIADVPVHAEPIGNRHNVDIALGRDRLQETSFVIMNIR